MRTRQSGRLSLDEWPSFDARALSEQERKIYRNRLQAVRAYSQGMILADIEAKLGVNRADIYRWLKRAEAVHPDGRVWGHRALVRFTRVGPYQRDKVPFVLLDNKAGNAGAFGQLLEKFPLLRIYLRAELQTSRVRLTQSSFGRPRLVGLKACWNRFILECKRIGLKLHDYPLNQKDRAIRSLARTLRAWLAEDPYLSVRLSGASPKPHSALRLFPDHAATDIYDTVEFDAHKMDLRLKVIDIDPNGNEQVLEIERVWLLAVIDVCSRCIIGFHLSLNRECSRFDVIETFKNAVLPAKRPALSLPGLKLDPQGGFVSTQFESTRYAVWRQIRLDNARAHLSSNSLDVLCESLGCSVNFGPAYSPNDRPFIERFFGTLTSILSRRLPGSIDPKKTFPKAALARLQDPKETLRLMVTPTELDEILQMVVWNYNGSPHSGLNALSPLEVVQRHIEGIGRAPSLLRHLPLPLRTQPELLHDPVFASVRANLSRGERPHISFLHVRYTSKQLASRSDLIGQRLRLYFNPTDLRRLTAYTEHGHALDDLLASGAWLRHAHSLQLRRQIFRAKRAKQLDLDITDDPIEAFVALRRSSATKKKRSASDIAQVRRGQAKADAKPPSEEPPSAVPGHSQLVPPGRIVGRKLRIARGFTR